ncbi:MAG TPA: hypothetical protein DCS67_02210 [Clostridiales bacterium UBA8960]|nr:hypothetical protein [Clostridiales bacterium UBA8960]
MNRTFTLILILTMILAMNTDQHIAFAMGESNVHHSKVKFITIGGYNRFFINEADELWGWNDISGITYGALGLGHTEPVLKPVKILDDVAYVVGDMTTTMMIRKDGTLWMNSNKPI